MTLAINTPDHFGDLLNELSLDADAMQTVARAFDKEDSAQRGEPDPWDSIDPASDSDREWMEERMGCALAGLEALRDYWNSLERKAAP